MDKLWSILPIVYAWIIAAKGDFSLRLIVYAVIVTAWGIRLTVNFARKGAYRLKFWEGREDYRWSVVKSSPVFSNGFLWTLFDLFFISIYQNLLVLAICLPALACMGSSEPFAAADIVAAVLAVAFLVLETVADEYQWNFHKKKQGFLAEGKTLSELPSPYNLGFNTLGPWSRMRHPNYLGEQGIWLSLYLFTIGAGVTSNGIFNITAIGPLLLILLFMGSSALGEKISSGKYPSYKDYINQVYKYLPLKKFKP
jgi:steroid 5-alpha reductase family enzyme